MFHHDGVAWRTVPPLAGIASHQFIYGLSGSPDGKFWAVGENGMTMRWNGTELQYVPSHTATDLGGAWVGPARHITELLKA